MRTASFKLPPFKSTKSEIGIMNVFETYKKFFGFLEQFRAGVASRAFEKAGILGNRGAPDIDGECLFASGALELKRFGINFSNRFNCAHRDADQVKAAIAHGLEGFYKSRVEPEQPFNGTGRMADKTAASRALDFFYLPDPIEFILAKIKLGFALAANESRFVREHGGLLWFLLSAPNVFDDAGAVNV
jgi:hypothetical protein